MRTDGYTYSAPVISDVLPTLGIGGLSGGIILFAARIYLSADKTRLAQVKELTTIADARQVRINELELEAAGLHDERNAARSEAAAAKDDARRDHADLVHCRELMKRIAEENVRLRGGDRS